MGKVLGKESCNYKKANTDLNILLTDTKPPIEMSPLQNFSKEEEEKQILSFFEIFSKTIYFFQNPLFFIKIIDYQPIVDYLLDKETIIPLKYLEMDRKALRKKKKFKPTTDKYSLNCIKKMVSRRKRRLYIDNFDLDLW